MGNLCTEKQQHGQTSLQAEHTVPKYSNAQRSVPKKVRCYKKPMPALSEEFKDILAKQQPLAGQPSLKGQNQPSAYLPDLMAYYKGEWKDKVPHGKGIMYFDDDTLFSGFFDMGEANCRDAVYIYPDASYYRGEIKKSMFNGEGIFRHSKGNVVYSGSWENDKPNGYGREQFADGSVYEGQYKDGYKHGKGTYIWKNGMVYKGEFKLGYMWGEGVLKKGNGYYEGEFLKNEKTATHGTIKTEYGVYQGPLYRGQMQGEGQFIWNDKKVYTGGFEEGALHGEGVIVYPNGQSVRGVWKKGENVKVFETAPL